MEQRTVAGTSKVVWKPCLEFPKRFSLREAPNTSYAGFPHDLGGTCDRALSHISIPAGPRLEPYCPGFANVLKMFINLLLVFSVFLLVSRPGDVWGGTVCAWMELAGQVCAKSV